MTEKILRFYVGKYQYARKRINFKRIGALYNFDARVRARRGARAEFVDIFSWPLT